MKKTILNVTYDPANPIKKFGFSASNMNFDDALGLLHPMTVNNTVSTIGQLTEDDKKKIHLAALVIAATTAPNIFTVKQEADMYADFVIASKVMGELMGMKADSMRNEKYAQRVKQLSDEYDNAEPTRYDK